MSESSWEKELIVDFAQSVLKEKRQTRRWKIFFRLAFLTLTAIFLYASLFMTEGPSVDKNAPHTALIEFDGALFDKEKTNANNIVAALQTAYQDKGTKAILLRINSPGGSPVQAHYIYSEMNRLKKRFPEIKTYAVCVDLCASAAYYVASAADFIYADQASLVGSIGVISESFGFTGTLNKLGIERRIFKAGSNKSFMDPFSPVTPEETSILNHMLDTVHTQFKKAVLDGRGKRLSAPDNKDLFSGLVWLGEDAFKMGLIDGFGSPGSVARDVIKEANIIDYTISGSYLERIAKRFGQGFGENLDFSLKFLRQQVFL